MTDPYKTMSTDELIVQSQLITKRIDALMVASDKLMGELKRRLDEQQLSISAAEQALNLRDLHNQLKEMETGETL